MSVTQPRSYSGPISKDDQFFNSDGDVATVIRFDPDGNVVSYRSAHPKYPERTGKSVGMCGRDVFLTQFPYRVEESVKEVPLPAEALRVWTTGWWLWRRTIEVSATQVILRNSSTKKFTGAKVRVLVNGRPRFRATIGWLLPPGENHLVMQVYALAQHPGLRLSLWARVLEEFVFRVDPNLSPPSEIHEPTVRGLISWEELAEG